MQLRVLLGFSSAGDHQLEENRRCRHQRHHRNATYPNPPVTPANLQTALTAFTAAIATQEQGGTAATADKNNKRDALTGLLRPTGRLCANELRQRHGQTAFQRL